jgi:hypothetical protein
MTRKTTRRSVLATLGAASTAGCLSNPLLDGHDGTCVLTTVEESPYIGGFNVEHDPKNFSGNYVLTISVPQNTPEAPKYYILTRNGEQEEFARYATGETRVQMRYYEYLCDEYEDILVVGGGEYAAGAVSGGELLDRVPVRSNGGDE